MVVQRLIAAMKDVPIKSLREEYVTDMVQRGIFAARKDAPTMLSKEEYV